MFEQFGEMGSAAEINLLADNLVIEGDIESVKKLAAENGIDPADVEDYLAGDMPELCTDLSAAIGKLELEAKELGLKELMSDWVEWIKAECIVKVDGEFAFAKKVRAKGKTLSGALGAILKKSWEIKWKIPEKIVKAAGISNARVEFGIPGNATVRKIIHEYYGG